MADEPKYKVADDLRVIVPLYSGKEAVIDMMRVSTREWKQVTLTKVEYEEEAAVLAKSLGMTTEEVLELPQPDYRKLVEAFIGAGTQPLQNPT